MQYKTKDSNWERLNDYHHHKMNIRRALFIYFSITLGKPPVWYDFWSLERNHCKRMSPDISKNHLTDLEAFDRHYRREVVRAQMHMDVLYEGEVGLEGKLELSDGE